MVNFGRFKKLWKIMEKSLFGLVLYCIMYIHSGVDFMELVAIRACNRVDLLAYEDIMNVSDAVQGIFEYD